MMTELNKIAEVKARAEKYLLLSIEHFRYCQDQQGLEAFGAFIADLENLLGWYAYGDQPYEDFDRLLPALRKLDACLENQDITGMTDILQYELYPLLKGNENCDHRSRT